ncbi:hypothetical protein H0A36_23625 [Endozoicomonas sp. SM1973]|uniref:Uncharacterized protein n=2 Tax=Spartinivicinus marinus TaxID=2994442 RepID=A0A853IIU8_9GAMM|nr:hypothetical protein [Spartinivicinus marinus]MCX4026039.1 hypothetical protein [Spartinivicinus marinus]NYZ69015.1 hypothetical protein [Spartinivicinus marinus]
MFENKFQWAKGHINHLYVNLDKDGSLYIQYIGVEELALKKQFNNIDKYTSKAVYIDDFIRHHFLKSENETKLELHGVKVVGRVLRSYLKGCIDQNIFFQQRY